MVSPCTLMLTCLLISFHRSVGPSSRPQVCFSACRAVANFLPHTAVGLVTNYGQLLALRFCLGLFEAGLFPGLNFYL